MGWFYAFCMIATVLAVACLPLAVAKLRNVANADHELDGIKALVLGSGALLCWFAAAAQSSPTWDDVGMWKLYVGAVVWLVALLFSFTGPKADGGK